MATFNTRQGITWSDSTGFDAESIIDFYNQIQSNKRADAAETRADERLEIAKNEILQSKIKEEKLIKSQQFLNEAIMKHNKSGWEDGKYTGISSKPGDSLESRSNGKYWSSW